MVEFRVTCHALKPGDMVEVWEDGEFKAAIYPGLPPKGGIHVVSSHIKDALEAPQVGPVRSWLLTFQPSGEEDAKI